MKSLVVWRSGASCLDTVKVVPFLTFLCKPWILLTDKTALMPHSGTLTSDYQVVFDLALFFIEKVHVWQMMSQWVTVFTMQLFFCYLRIASVFFFQNEKRNNPLRSVFPPKVYSSLSNFIIWHLLLCSFLITKDHFHLQTNILHLTRMARGKRTVC